MAITYRTSNTAINAGSGSTSKPCNAPASIASGDFLLAFLAIGTPNATASSSGWTQVESLNGNSQRTIIFYKVAGSSEPASYTFTTSATSWTDIAILRYDGQASSSAYDISSSTYNSPATTTPATPSITTARANNLLITIFSDLNASGLTNPAAPTGETRRLFFDGSHWISDEVQASAGATGAKSSSAGASVKPTGTIISVNSPSVAPTITARRTLSDRVKSRAAL